VFHFSYNHFKRIKIFRRELIGHSLTIASSVKEGVDKFTKHYDLVFLDHDLDGTEMAPLLMNCLAMNLLKLN